MIELAEPLSKYMKKTYPHLTEQDMQVIFENARCSVQPDFDDFFPHDETRKRIVMYNCIKIRFDIAEFFGISSELPLITNEEGISWSWHTTNNKNNINHKIAKK